MGACCVCRSPVTALVSAHPAEPTFSAFPGPAAARGGAGAAGRMEAFEIE